MTGAETTTAVLSTSDDPMSIANLFLHASIPVQAIMVLLLLISVISWAMIFQRSSVLNKAAREGKNSKTGSGRVLI